MVNTMTEAVKRSHVADDILFEEVKSHAIFCLEKAEQVIGKEEILDQVEKKETTLNQTQLNLNILRIYLLVLTRFQDRSGFHHCQGEGEGLTLETSAF